MQITKNDTTPLVNIDSSGNMTSFGDVFADKISLQGVYDKLTKLKYFSYAGWMFNTADGGTIEGTGHATLIKYPNGLYEIHFMFKINVRGADSLDSSRWRYGINRDAFKSMIGETITPLGGGYWQCQLPDGTPYTEKTGYGTLWNADGQFWRPSRVHTTNGGVGTWPLSSPINDLGNIWTGVCFGKGAV